LQLIDKTDNKHSAKHRMAW